jgi:hypothetical protein
MYVKVQMLLSRTSSNPIKILEPALLNWEITESESPRGWPQGDSAIYRDNSTNIEAHYVLVEDRLTVFNSILSERRCKAYALICRIHFLGRVIKKQQPNK